VIYVGSKTGRDGIHGASMASAKFDDKIEEKKPTVQVGDPFTEKLLLEACLELMKDDSIISIQDSKKIIIQPAITYPFKDKFGNRFVIKAETSLSAYMLSHVSRTGSYDYNKADSRNDYQAVRVTNPGFTIGFIVSYNQ
jgi:hypothetical protein